jgi:hypothetical protein
MTTGGPRRTTRASAKRKLERHYARRTAALPRSAYAPGSLKDTFPLFRD